MQWRETLIKFGLTLVVGMLMMWCFGTIAPSNRAPKYQTVLNSYSTPIKVIAVHGKRYQMIAFFEDEKGKRGMSFVSEDDPVIIGDEIELYLDWSNDTCARRKIK